MFTNKEGAMSPDVNTDLTGWQIVIWYKLITPKPKGNNWRVVGYFEDKQIAQAVANKGGSWGKTGEIREVKILTQDNKTGYVLQPKTADLSKQESLVADTRQKILSQFDLDPDEKIILGLDSEK